MTKYELAVAITVKIEDEERTAVIDNCKALIERFGGVDLTVDEWGKKRLAYEIDKMKEAYYYFIQFSAPTTAPAEIESRMRIMENVVRYLVVKADQS
jgi:small subunit ribosomal protein S6